MVQKRSFGRRNIEGGIFCNGRGRKEPELSSNSSRDCNPDISFGKDVMGFPTRSSFLSLCNAVI